jgi:diguanylate cyclase (GGDEF)-like protein
VIARWGQIGKRALFLFGVGALACALVTVVAGTRPGLAVTVGAGFSGLLAAVTGLLVAVPVRHGRSARRAADVLLGAAMLVWGLGQMLVGLAALDGPLTYPSLGDQSSPLAAPLAVAGLLLAMRPTSLRTHWLRMTLDSMLLAVAICLLVWRLGYGAALRPGGIGVSDVLIMGSGFVEVLLVALLLLGWLRDLDRALGLMTVGLALYTVADLFTMHAASLGDPSPWVAAAMWCLAWPVIGLGILRFEPVETDDEGRASETRVAASTTVITTGALVGTLAELSVDRRLDVVTIAAAVLVVVLLGVREVYAGATRARMLGRLTLYAYTDPLTGLGNRRALQAHLEKVSASSGCAVLTLDLDGFKEVNDLLGHTWGDQLLVAVADSIREAMPADAAAFRVGGDEFLVLVPGGEHSDAAVADGLLQAVRRAADLLPGAGLAGVSASIGLAWWSPAVGDPSLAVLHSGVALHAAKESGRDRVESYDGPVAARHRRSLDVERRLRIALERGDLDVHYQPILSLDTGRITSIEALARWVDPVLGRVGPDEFIAVAERSALIGQLGMYVLERAVRDVRSLDDRHSDLRVAVNVSPVQLRSPSFAQHVEDMAAQHGLSPHRLVVEVTESVFVADEDDDTALGNLQRLRRSGINVAIDDFGSGYSSLNYLSRLPASILKVDQALTASVTQDGRALSVLRAVVELGRSVSMDVAVEGIETQQVHDIVRGFGGCMGQGWLYSAAVPLHELSTLIADVDSRVALST